MKIVYYSGLQFADCDFPLVKAYQQAGEDVTYIIPLLCDKLNGPLLSIGNQIQKSDILQATDYEEFRKYSNYMDLSDTLVVNRITKGGTFRNVLLYFRLALKLMRMKPDVVHITTPLAGPEFPLYLLRKKMVLTVHDPFPHSGEMSVRKENQRLRAFRKVRKFILLNARQRRKFVKNYKIEKPVLVNRLGVYDALNAFDDVHVEEGGYILHFGRISPYKGIEYLCEAMEKVHEKNPSLKCIIAGSGVMYFDHRKYLDKPYMKFMNRYIGTEELASLISGALFCVCPYTDATQSGVISSAFALCKPVLATDVGALGESVSNGYTGRLIAAKDASLLADTILEMAADQEKLNEMSVNIERESRSGDMSWTEIADKNLRFYEE